MLLVSSSVRKELTLSQNNLDSSELKEFAGHNFKFVENGGKFSKREENVVGEGRNAHCEQFLLFPHCFQKTCTAHALKQGIGWERVSDPLERCLLKIVKKGENTVV